LPVESGRTVRHESATVADLAGPRGLNDGLQASSMTSLATTKLDFHLRQHDQPRILKGD